MPTRSLPYSSRQWFVFVVPRSVSNSITRANDYEIGSQPFQTCCFATVPALTLLIRNLDNYRLSGDEHRYAALEAFLARCRKTEVPDGSITGWVCASFGIERQFDWPAGAILARAHGADHGAAYWICAQPVHLAINRDDLVLQPRAQLGLSDSESRTLFALLEPHFAEYELAMVHIDTGLWCVGSRRNQHLATTEIERAEGSSVDRSQPSGKDAAWWQRLVLEAQMRMHEQPLNVAREQRDDLPVNSLWLWGGGSVPQVSNRFDTMCVSEPLLRAAALLSQAKLIEMPSNALDVMAEDAHVLVEYTVSAEDTPGASLAALESNWIAPAWRALDDGRLDQLTLVLPLPNGLVTCHCDRKARRRFWKRSQALPKFLFHLQTHQHSGS